MERERKTPAKNPDDAGLVFLTKYGHRWTRMNRVPRADGSPDEWIAVDGAALVFDRFHIMKLFNDQLSQWCREMTDQFDRRAIKGTRWLLLTNCEDLEDDQLTRRNHALELNQPLATAYYLKDSLRELWEQRGPLIAIFGDEGDALWHLGMLNRRRDEDQPASRLAAAFADDPVWSARLSSASISPRTNRRPTA